MSRILLTLASLLLASGAGAQTPRPASATPQAFYAEATYGSLHTRLFGTVRLRPDSVEVMVSGGSIGRPWVSLEDHGAVYTGIGLRPFLSREGLGEPDPSAPGASVVVLPSIGAGAEHPIGAVRFVLPRPAGPPDRLGLVFQVTGNDPAPSYHGDGFFLVYACGRYGAFAVSRTQAEPYGTCVAPGERESRQGPAAIPSRAALPVRHVCVEDATSPTGLRPSDVIVQRLAGDSVLSRSGERLLLSEFRPRIVGYAAGPRGLEPATVNVRDPFWNEGGVLVMGHRYAPYGQPRPIPPSRVTRIGEVFGASIFITPRPDMEDAPEHVYVLLPDCRSQPYRRLPSPR